MGEVRWDLVAQGLGCHGEFVQSLADLPAALERARHDDRPALVCVRTEQGSEPVDPGRRRGALLRSLFRAGGMKTLQGKRVLITGAASGIGLECARAFARRGANLVISDINATALDGLRREIAGMGVGLPRPALRRDQRGVGGRARGRGPAPIGPLDVLVNNAGIAYLGSFEEMKLAWWRRTFDVNVLGIVHCIQAFLPAMRAAGGERKIVNVASLAGVAPAPNMSAYAASKHAVIGLSEVLALELHDSPSRCWWCARASSTPTSSTPRE